MTSDQRQKTQRPLTLSRAVERTVRSDKSVKVFNGNSLRRGTPAIRIEREKDLYEKKKGKEKHKLKCPRVSIRSIFDNTLMWGKARLCITAREFKTEEMKLGISEQKHESTNLITTNFLEPPSGSVDVPVSGRGFLCHPSHSLTFLEF